MGVLPIIILHFFVNGISSYEITKNEEIGNAWVTNVKFDAKGNSYIAYFDDLHFFHLNKLSTTGKIVSGVDLESDYADMIVSSRGDAYFDFFSNKSHKIVIVREGNIKAVDEMEFMGLFHLDGNDNFFYCKKNVGVHVLRPDSSSAVPVANLNDCVGVSNEKTISDKLGNTYFVVKRNDKESLALVGKGALESETPNATFIYTARHKSEFIVAFTVDEENRLWMTTADYENSGNAAPRESSIKKYKNGTWEDVLTQKGVMYREIASTKSRTYVIAKHYDPLTRRIFYINPNNEVVEIPELKNISSDYSRFKGLADREGRAYFYNTEPEFSKSYGMMVAVSPNETRPIPISIPSGNYKRIKSIQFDFNGDMWIVIRYPTKGILHLKKGESALKVRNDLKESCDFLNGDIHFNFVTKKMYMSCFDGLYVG